MAASLESCAGVENWHWGVVHGIAGAIISLLDHFTRESIERFELSARRLSQNDFYIVYKCFLKRESQ